MRLTPIAANGLSLDRPINPGEDENESRLFMRTMFSHYIDFPITGEILAPTQTNARQKTVVGMQDGLSA